MLLLGVIMKTMNAVPGAALIPNIIVINFVCVMGGFIQKLLLKPELNTKRLALCQNHSLCQVKAVQSDNQIVHLKACCV
jgi:hypothetical protein